jgi:hypothetical protein
LLVLKKLKLDREGVAIPASQLRELIVGKDVRPTTGTEAKFNNLAAASLPWPAITSRSSETRMGLAKPKRSIESAICRICFFEWVRALPA